MADTTPANVAETATIPNVLSMQSLTVIGVMNAQDGGAALLRSPRGEIARVVTGASAFGVTVAAIDDAQVVLVDPSGTAHALRVPGT